MNYVLIGLPGSGKSTLGVLLAKYLGYSFLDADIVIQESTGKLLREIIEEEGPEGFIEVENKNENETVENRNKELLQFIDKMNLDINRRNREGYSNMLYRKNRGVCND